MVSRPRSTSLRYMKHYHDFLRKWMWYTTTPSYQTCKISSLFMQKVLYMYEQCALKTKMQLIRVLHYSVFFVCKCHFTTNITPFMLITDRATRHDYRYIDNEKTTCNILVDWGVFRNSRNQFLTKILLYIEWFHSLVALIGNLIKYD